MDPNIRYDRNDQIMLEILDRINSENVNDTLEWCCTALQFACSQGNVEAVERLLEIPGINVNCMDEERWTPLYDACNGNFEVIEKLLAFPGIDVNILTTDGKIAPLHRALLSFNYDFTHNPQYTDDMQVISKLLAFYDIDVNIRDGDGLTPLHYVSLGMGDYNPEVGVELIRKLLAVPGIDVNIRGYNSRTPIMEAANDGETEALKALLKDSRTDLNLKDKDGRSLEELVAMSSRVNVEHLETIMLIKEERKRREKDRMQKKLSNDDISDNELECVRKNVRKQYGERLDRVCENIEHENFRLRKLAVLKQNEIKALKERKHSEVRNLEIKVEGKKVEIEKKKVELKEKITQLEKQLLDLDQNLIDLEQNKFSETESINDKYREKVLKLEEKFVEDEKGDKLENFMKLKSQLTSDLESFEGILNDHAPSKYREKVEAAKDTLECPVCFEIMSPPTRIWMCSVGHLVCEPCKNKLGERKCPTYRTGKVKQRSIMAENFARAVLKESG